MSTEWIAPFIPAPGLVLRLAPLAAAYGILAAWAVGYLRMRRGVRTPYTRKLFHFAIFTMAGVVQLTWGLPGVVIYGSIIALLVGWALLQGEGYPFYEALARPSDSPRRTLFIIVPLITTALGGVCANLLFPSLAFVGYLVCGWGDAVGEPVGTRWGVHRYRVPSIGGVPATRSLEGSAAVLVAGSVAAFLGLLLSGMSVPSAAYLGAAAGVAGAAVEAISNHGLDNFTVQVAAAGVRPIVAPDVDLRTAEGGRLPEIVFEGARQAGAKAIVAATLAPDATLVSPGPTIGFGFGGFSSAGGWHQSSGIGTGVGVAVPVGADHVTTAYGANLTLTDVATGRLMWASKVTTPASSDIAEQVSKLAQAGREAAQQAGFF